MDKPMVERVARAICKAQTQGEETWAGFIPEAQAAMTEMRWATHEMWEGWRSVNCKRGDGGMEEFTYFSGDYGNWLACHQRMMDAAIRSSEAA